MSRWGLAAVAVLVALCQSCDGAVPYAANLVACGSISSGCNHVLPVSINQPLGGTDPFYVQYCSGPGYKCLPVSYPVGDWVSSYVFNSGNADAAAFTVGLYLSRRVNADGSCALDTSFPLRDAVQLATVSFPTGLAQGAFEPISFPRGNAIEYWMASQWNAGRDKMFRCLFVYVNDGSTVYELQPDASDNIASAPVRLLDLVDLQVSDFRAKFLPDSADARRFPSGFPWMSALVYNYGIATAPTFSVDFYQIDADLVKEQCPVLVNQEFPLVVNRTTHRYAVFLGNTMVYNLGPKQSRVVFPQLSRVPATDYNVTTTCLLVFVDSAYNVPEPRDGPANILTLAVAVDAIRRFLVPPKIIIIPGTWNKFIILYIVLGIIGLCIAGYFWWRYRKYAEQVERHEAQYMERAQMKPPPPPPVEPDPIPFFKPDLEFLQKEEEEAKNNPSFNRVIRVTEQVKKTGIVRDKKGNVIGTISPGGVIRDKTGRRIGVSGVGSPLKAPSTRNPNVLDGYFGSSA